MEDATKGVSPVEETTPAAVETREDARKAAQLREDPHTAIYEKYDAIKAAREAAEAPPAEEEVEETPPLAKASGKTETTEEPAKEPVVEELTPEQFKERFRNVKVKGKFAGEEAVVSAEDLLRVQGLDRHLTKRLQEVARKEESLGAVQQPYTPPPVDATYPPHVPVDKALRHWGENEVAAKYDELFSESPYKAQNFLNAVQSERQKVQAENERTRMDTAEKDFLAIHSELESSDYDSMKKSFSDPEFFRQNPDVDHAFQRRDYYGALELARVKLIGRKLDDKLKEIKTAQEAIASEEQRKVDLKKKGSVIRTTTKQEVKPQEEFKELSPAEIIAEEGARRRGLMNR